MSKLTDRILDAANPTRFTRLERVELPEGSLNCLCPPDEQPIEPYPVGFFKAMTRSGLDGEIGFYCAKCHLVIQCGLEPGQSIKHCKKTERVPHANGSMEVRRIGTFKGEAAAPEFYFVPVGTL
jgi:hypothetical protein